MPKTSDSRERTRTQSLAAPVSSEKFAPRGRCASPRDERENACKSTKSAKGVWENVPMTTTMEVPQRKWALTKIKAGDWLLPSNDTKTIWRIYSYVDGVSMGLDFPDRTYWDVARWTGRMDVLDVEDWDRWEQQGAMFDTRAEAIDWTLRQGADR